MNRELNDTESSLLLKLFEQELKDDGMSDSDITKSMTLVIALMVPLIYILHHPNLPKTLRAFAHMIELKQELHNKEV